MKQLSTVTLQLITIILITTLYSVMEVKAQQPTIETVSPTQATQGDTNIVVTLTLGENGTPPAQINPSAVKIDTLNGRNISRNNLLITATFDIPSNETLGFKNVSVQFPTPNGTLGITKTNGFQILSSSGSSSVIYVDANNTSGTYNGTTWATAYPTIQEGLDAATNTGATEVWVAAATYTPPTTTDRSISIQLQPNVAVYGGFNATETSRTQRNWNTNLTILSGDIGVAGNNSDNAYHVLIGADNAILDGFTISHGNANGVVRHSKGGGIINYTENNVGLSPTLNNIIFSNNKAEEGGAMYNAVAANPSLNNCTFSQNQAKKGGAIANQNAASPTIGNCTFSNNYANWRGGAIFIDYGSSPTITNTTFIDNSTGGHGGAIYADDTASQHGGTYPTIDACTFTNNSAAFFGGAIQAYNNATPTISNSAFNNNSAANGGGAIAVQYNTTTYVNNNSYSGNTSTQNAANIYIDATSTVITNTTSTTTSYYLFAPMNTTETYLINNNGNTVYTWSSTYRPGLSVYLLENGNLLRTGTIRGSTPFSNTGGVGGAIQLIEANNNVTWEYQYTSNTYSQHHDVEILPNGNILFIAWQYKTDTEAIAAGRNPALLNSGQLWPDSIIEVNPNNNSIVWEWHVWDHLIQDYDNTKANYGVISDHPELIDLNYTTGEANADWNHINAVDYNAEFDQIILSVHGFSEIWIIDHSTTTAEAASHTGGNSGKGGDLLYRWGNPRTYGQGTINNQQLFVQHDARWIESGYTGAGNILIFNNGQGRPDGDYSTVEEIVPPVTANGVYTLATNSAYGPATPTWTYTANPATSLFANHISGAQRLLNGNTLICDGPNSTFFEVTPTAETVWSYTYSGGELFRATRYEANYAGLPPLNRTSPFNPIQNTPKGKPSKASYPMEKQKTASALTVYVDSNNTNGTQDGTTWATAYTTIQQGIDTAQNAGGGQVWVAAGTYKPTNTISRAISIQLAPNVAVYGGFNGTESSLTQRDWQNNPTILSGDIGTPNNNTDNSYHVVKGADNAILDGFTITGGYALGEQPPTFNRIRAIQATSPEEILASEGSGSGGGILNFQGAPILRNLIITGNTALKGGGMYNMVAISPTPEDNQALIHPTLSNISFENNTANTRGGAMSNDLWTHPVMTNVTFINNSTQGKGGAIYNDFGCSPQITNCLFTGNSANRGGAIGNDGSSSPTIINCTFSQNHAVDQGATLYQGSYLSSANIPTVLNSILWGNTVAYTGAIEISNWHEDYVDISYSIIEGGYNTYTTIGNLSSNPLFINADNGNYQLNSNSPAINAGSSNGSPTTDLLGNLRDNAPDIGAYEYINLNSPNLSLNKSVSTANTPAQPGDTITYTITLANFGDVTANNVSVSDILPNYINGTNLITNVTIVSGTQQVFTLIATLDSTAPSNIAITNLALYTHTSSSGQATATFNTAMGSFDYAVYLPLVLK